MQAAHWVDEGMVKSIRGVTFSTRVSPQIGSRMIYASRGIFNRFIPDVHIFTDHRTGPSGGRYNYIFFLAVPPCFLADRIIILESGSSLGINIQQPKSFSLVVRG